MFWDDAGTFGRDGRRTVEPARVMAKQRRDGRATSGRPRRTAPAGPRPPLVLRDRDFRDILENAGDIAYTIDLVEHFTWINRAASEITGYRFGETGSVSVRTIVAPEHLEHARAMMMAKLAGGGPTRYEARYRDGRRPADPGRGQHAADLPRRPPDRGAGDRPRHHRAAREAEAYITGNAGILYDPKVVAAFVSLRAAEVVIRRA